MGQHFSKKIRKFSESISIPEAGIRLKYDFEFREKEFININNVIVIDYRFERIEEILISKDVIKYILTLPNGYLLLSKFGIDRGYPRTASEISEETGLTKKAINYWVNKNIELCKNHFIFI